MVFEYFHRYSTHMMQHVSGKGAKFAYNIFARMATVSLPNLPVPWYSVGQF